MFVIFYQLRAVADDLKLPIHMDGARIMNAAVSLGVPVKEICQYADSVSVCLSKVSIRTRNF